MEAARFNRQGHGEGLPVSAVQHVRRMRGGAQGHLMRCSDGNFYVVKFRNNPQHLRVLANELLATRLGERVGLPVASAEVVDVSSWLVDKTPDLRIQLAGGSIPCSPGLQFGSRYAVDPRAGMVFDYLPSTLLPQVRNLNAFAGMLALDKWTNNTNGRQAAFWRNPRERKYTVTFIDQGYCFNAGEWSFADAPLRGVFANNDVYADVSGWASFEPWLTRLEKLPAHSVWDAANEVPPEFYDQDQGALEKLVEQLLRRQSRVRELILQFRFSMRNPFPMWRDEA